MYCLTRIDGEQFVGEEEPDQQGPEQPNYEEGKCRHIRWSILFTYLTLIILYFYAYVLIC